MAEQHWLMVVKCLDQSGVLSAVASVFANRGVSLEAILGSGIATVYPIESCPIESCPIESRPIESRPAESRPAESHANGRLLLSFRATERKKEMLHRVLERLSAILQVEVYAYDDPQLRAIAVIKVRHLEQIDLSSVLAETISQTAEAQTLLLTGSTVALEAIVQQLRQQALLIDLVMSAVTV